MNRRRRRLDATGDVTSSAIDQVLRSGIRLVDPVDDPVDHARRREQLLTSARSNLHEPEPVIQYSWWAILVHPATAAGIVAVAGIALLLPNGSTSRSSTNARDATAEQYAREVDTMSSGEVGPFSFEALAPADVSPLQGLPAFEPSSLIGMSISEALATAAEVGVAIEVVEGQRRPVSGTDSRTSIDATEGPVGDRDSLLVTVIAGRVVDAAWSRRTDG